MTRIVITGASGFLGRATVKAALDEPQITQVVASDLQPLDMRHPKLAVLTCDLTNPALLDAAGQTDVVLHLAGMLGGAAQADPDSAFAINVTASLNLMAACRQGTRFVFASSIAVLGDTTDSRAPVMVYGKHKAEVEVALEQATKQGTLDGISLRPGGIVARPGLGKALKSAFMSQVFHAVRDGADITLPVSEDAKTWLASAPTVAGQFLTAALTPDLGPSRSLTLPMMRLSFRELVTALQSAFPDSQSRIVFAPDAEIMRLFGHARDFNFTGALRLGLTPDPDAATLIRNALQDGDIK